MECKDYIVNNSLIALKTTYTRALIYNMLRKIKEAFVDKNIICFSPRNSQAASTRKETAVNINVDEIILNFLSLEIKEYVPDEIEYNRKNPRYVNDLTYLVQIM